MVKEERTGERCSKYSEWHRTLGPEYHAIDIDFIEWRSERGVVGVLGVTGRLNNEEHIRASKQVIWNRTGLERTIMSQVGAAFGVPSFLVMHTADLSAFHVHEAAAPTPYEYRRMNREEYADFIKGL